MKIKNTDGEIIKGIKNNNPAFGIEYEDREGNIRYIGITYNIRHGITLDKARKICKELKSGKDKVNWANIMVFDENGLYQNVKE